MIFVQVALVPGQRSRVSLAIVTSLVVPVRVIPVLQRLVMTVILVLMTLAIPAAAQQFVSIIRIAILAMTAMPALR